MLQKIIASILIITHFLLLSACTSSLNTLDAPARGETVLIYMQNGKIYEGLLIDQNRSTLKYIDNKKHHLVELKLSEIKYTKTGDTIYDYEAHEITAGDIKNNKSAKKTIAYGFGGVLLGSAVGFGIGILLADMFSIPPLYPSIAGGIGGGIYFGHQGSESDRVDAIEHIREQRFEKCKLKLQSDIQKKKDLIEKEKQKLKELKGKQKEKD